MKKLLFILSLTMAMISCSHKTTNNETVADGQTVEYTRPAVMIGSRPSGGGASHALPKATAFSINPEYADKVGVTLDSNGELVYYPAVSDINADSTPLDLGDGWWLNRQGIGAKSVFTKYTFKEYMNLPATPSPEEIKAAVIPESGVIRMVTLPFNAGESRSHIPEIKEYLNKQNNINFGNGN